MLTLYKGMPWQDVDADDVANIIKNSALHPQRYRDSTWIAQCRAKYVNLVWVMLLACRRLRGYLSAEGGRRATS